MSLYDLNGKILKNSDSDNYRNVKTGRTITDLNKTDFNYFKFNDDYICGNEINIMEFIMKNNLSKQKLIEQKYSVSSGKSTSNKSKTTNIYKKPDISSKKKPNISSKEGFIERAFNNIFHHEKKDIPEPTCEINTAGTALYIPDSNDIETIPSDILETMCPFELTGLKVKAKVVKIKDADTIDIAFFVNFSELAKPREKGTKHNKKMKVPILTKHLNADYCMVYSCRVNAIDAAEHSTAQGQLATLLLTDYLTTIGNIIYVKIIEYEKYGRLLIEMYSDSKMKNNIGEKLINIHVDEMSNIIKEGIANKRIEINSKKNKEIIYDTENQDFLALPYYGDTKSNILKNYYKVPNLFINEGDHVALLTKYRLK